MKSIAKLHRQAMEVADLAHEARRRGDSETERAKFQEAFLLERQAAEQSCEQPNAEPSRSILFRSAATLAVSAGLLVDAEKAIRQGLEGDPPFEIARELRELLDSFTTKSLVATHVTMEKEDQEQRDVLFPRISEVPIDVHVRDVLVSPGQHIEADQPYLVAETDKVDIEVPIPAECWVLKVHVKPGDTTREDDRMLTVTPSNWTRWDAQHGRVNIAMGLNYILGTSIREVVKPGLYSLQDATPFLDKVVAICRTIKKGGLDKLDDAAVGALGLTLYDLTHLISELRVYDPGRGFHSQEVLLRKIASQQERQLLRLLRAAAIIGGYPTDPDRELQEATAVFNCTRAYVFISHHHSDEKHARALAKRLERFNIAHFLDREGIQWGDEIPEKIHVALSRSSHVLIMLSSGGITSQRVAYEVGFARGCGIPVLPYLLDSRIAVPAFLSTRRHYTSDDEPDLLKEFKGFTRPPIRSADLSFP